MPDICLCEGEKILRVLGQLDQSHSEYTPLLKTITNFINGIGIKDSFSDLYCQNPLKKSILKEDAGRLIGSLIRSWMKIEDSDNIAKKFDRNFKFEEGSRLLDFSYLDDVLEPEFIRELFFTAPNTKVAIGPGELALWGLYKNIDFNDSIGDLLLDGKFKLEVKGSNATLGTNSMPFRMWSDVKKNILKLVPDEDFRNTSSHLGLKNSSELLKVLKSSGKYLPEISYYLMNYPLQDMDLINDFCKNLLKINTTEELLANLIALHLICYQRVDKFDGILFFNNTEFRTVPKRYLQIQPQNYSISTLSELLKKEGVSFRNWHGFRLGGCNIKVR